MKNVTKTLITSGMTLVLLTPAYAQDTQDNDKNWTIGGGAIVYQSPYEGEGTKIIPFPYVSFDNGAFFIDGQELGYHFIKDTNNGLFVDVIGTVNDVAGVDRSSINFDLGLRAGYSNEHIYFDVSVLQDVSDQHSGQRASATFATPINHGRFSIVPSVSAEWFSRKAVNHIYGISAEQNAEMIKDNRKSILPVYQIDGSTVNFNANLVMTYQVTDSWSVVALGGANYLGSKIRDNPSIVKDYELYGGAGVAYSF